MPPDEIILYWGEGCPGCAVLDAYLAANASGLPAAMTRKEIYRNRENYEELRRVGKARGVPEAFISIPFLVTGGQHVMGCSNIIAFLEDELPA